MRRPNTVSRKALGSGWVDGVTAAAYGEISRSTSGLVGVRECDAGRHGTPKVPYVVMAVWAFRYREDAERFSGATEAVGEVQPEVASGRRASWFQSISSGLARFAFLGFEFQWKLDRRRAEGQGVRRKRLQAACRRIKEWIKLNRHLPGGEFFERLNARLRGHYNYYGAPGNGHSLYRFYAWAINCAFKWLNTWEQFGRVIEFVSLARPCITEIPRRRVFA